MSQSPVARPATGESVPYLVGCPPTALRTPLSVAETLLYIDNSRWHLGISNGDRHRVVLPSVPTGAMLCQFNGVLIVATPRGERIAFTAHDGIATCPIEVPDHWAVRLLADRVLDAGAETWLQLRIDGAGFGLDASLPTEDYPALRAALAPRVGIAVSRVLSVVPGRSPRRATLLERPATWPPLELRARPAA